MLNLRSSSKGVLSPPAVARRPPHGPNPSTYDRRGGLPMGMSGVYQGRGGIRIKEEGRTTFVEVEMDITESEDGHQPAGRVTLWSTTGKWEDVTSSAPAFASQVGSGIEETFWRDMESAPNLGALDLFPSTRNTPPHDHGTYERPTNTSTTGRGLATPPHCHVGVTRVVSRTVSDGTNAWGSDYSWRAG
jgi:hypothetical protein